MSPYSDVSHLKDGQDVQLVGDAMSNLLHIRAHEFHVGLAHLVNWLLWKRNVWTRNKQIAKNPHYDRHEILQPIAGYKIEN